MNNNHRAVLQGSFRFFASLFAGLGWLSVVYLALTQEPTSGPARQDAGVRDQGVCWIC